MIDEKIDEKIVKLLGELVRYARKKDASKVKKLNEDYGKLTPQYYHNPLTRLELMCENCRTSCVMALHMPTLYDKLLTDAKKRYSEIKKSLNLAPQVS